VKSVQELKEELKEGYKKYCAVILDHKFYVNKNDTVPTTDAWNQAKEFLVNFNKRKFELYTITAYKDSVESGSKFDLGRWVQKTDHDGIIELFKNIISNADNSLYLKYPEIFNNLSDDQKFGKINNTDRKFEATMRDIISMYLSKTNNVNIIGESRKILEMIFDKLQELGYLPYDGSNEMQKSIRFLKGEDPNYELIKNNYPIVWTLIDQIKTITNEQHHNKAEMKNLDQYFKAENKRSEKSKTHISKIVFYYLLEALNYFCYEINFDDKKSIKWQGKKMYKAIVTKIDEDKNLIFFRELEKREDWKNGDTNPWGSFPSDKLIGIIVGDEIALNYQNPKTNRLFVTNQEKISN
tara:strand:- start:284 stop:1342 length:1059 start_codon:yes stop_codon:yes gene_type:complete